MGETLGWGVKRLVAWRLGTGVQVAWGRGFSGGLNPCVQHREATWCQSGIFPSLMAPAASLFLADFSLGWVLLLPCRPNSSCFGGKYVSNGFVPPPRLNAGVEGLPRCMSGNRASCRLSWRTQPCRMPLATLRPLQATLQSAAPRCRGSTPLPLRVGLNSATPGMGWSVSSGLFIPEGSSRHQYWGRTKRGNGAHPL